MLRHRGSSILREKSPGGDRSLNGVRRHGNKVSNRGHHHKVSNHRVSNRGSKAHSPDNNGPGSPGPHSRGSSPGPHSRGSSPGRDNQGHMVPRQGPTGGRCTLRRRSRELLPSDP